MASEGTEESRAVAVAKVATRLFGSEIGPDAVIDESLQRATDDTITLAHATAGLADVLKQPIPANLDDEQLRKHPLSVWAELALGLDDGLELKRKKPIPFEDAVKRLADDSRVDQEQCRKHLEDFLTLVSLAEQRRYEEQRRRKRDANRWRRFRELAQDWHDLAVVRDFLVLLRSMDATPTAMIDGRSVQEWIEWAEAWLQRADPTADGVGGVFKQVAEVTDWNYRD